MASRSSASFWTRSSSDIRSTAFVPSAASSEDRTERCPCPERLPSCSPACPDTQPASGQGTASSAATLALFAELDGAPTRACGA
eukprot:scaffold8456_cov210-Pinguiococcus_pyrenoidosus.AAC.1